MISWYCVKSAARSWSFSIQPGFSLSSSQYIGTFLCGNAPPIKTTCAQVSSTRTERVVKLLQYDTSLSSLYYSLAFLHQWEGSQASMSRSCMQSLSSCPVHIKNLHILLIFPNISWKQLLFLIFLFFKAAQKSSCCSFRSDLLSQLRVHFQLESNLTFDLEIGVKRRKVNLLRILLQEKLKTLSSYFYLDLLQTATNWTRKRELTSCMKNNFTLLAHEISL